MELLKKRKTGNKTKAINRVYRKDIFMALLKERVPKEKKWQIMCWTIMKYEL